MKELLKLIAQYVNSTASSGIQSELIQVLSGEGKKKTPYITIEGEEYFFHSRTALKDVVLGANTDGNLCYINIENKSILEYEEYIQLRKERRGY